MHHNRIIEKRVRRLTARDIFDSQSSMSPLSQVGRTFGTLIQLTSSPQLMDKESISSLAGKKKGISNKMKDLDQVKDGKVLLSEMQLFQQTLGIVMNFHKMRGKDGISHNFNKTYDVVKSEMDRMKTFIQEEISQLEGNCSENISKSLQSQQERQRSNK